MKPDFTASTASCREALRRGHLTLDWNKWKFGRRRFGAHIVAQLILDGEAVRLGDCIVARRLAA